MTASKVSSRPSIMPSRLKEWLMRCAGRLSSSGRMLRMLPCDSFTTTFAAPPSSAPRIAALTSSVISRRPRPYSAPAPEVCSAPVTPLMPSMSAEMYTFLPGWVDVGGLPGCASPACHERAMSWAPEAAITTKAPNRMNVLILIVHLDSRRRTVPPTVLRPTLRDDAQQLEQKVRGQQRRDLPRTIERRGHLDNVTARQGEAAQAPDQLLRLAACQAADLRRARTGREGGVHGIDVEGDVDRSCSHDVPDRRHRAVDTQLRHALDVGNRDALLAVIVEIVLAVHGTANPNLNEPRGIDQLLVDGPSEWRPVEVLRPKVLFPRVDVRIELDEAERAMPPRQRP